MCKNWGRMIKSTLRTKDLKAAKYYFLHPPGAEPEWLDPESVPSARPGGGRSRWPVPPTPTTGEVDVAAWHRSGARILVSIQLRLVGKGMDRARRSSISDEGRHRREFSRAIYRRRGKY